MADLSNAHRESSAIEFPSGLYENTQRAQLQNGIWFVLLTAPPPSNEKPGFYMVSGRALEWVENIKIGEPLAFERYLSDGAHFLPANQAARDFIEGTVTLTLRARKF